MNIQTLLNDLDIPYQEAGQSGDVREGWIGLVCPWCGQGTGKHYLGINLEKGFASCWSCGPHTLADVLMELTGEPFAEVRHRLDRITARKGPSTPSKDDRRRGCVKLPLGVAALTGAHRRYLQGRGFDPDTITRLWGVRGIGVGVRLAWRLWIPIHHRGEVVSWTTRSIGRGQQRYINARVDEEVVSAKSILYGADLARHAIIVVEGPTDAWRIGAGGVATMGVGYSREQMTAMIEYPVRVVCFDNEPAARRRQHKLIDELSGHPGETFGVELETGNDLASADQGEVDAVRGMFLNRKG